jgi:hypothetical protein
MSIENLCSTNGGAQEKNTHANLRLRKTYLITTIRVFVFQIPQVGCTGEDPQYLLAINGDCPGGLVDLFWNPA